MKGAAIDPRAEVGIGGARRHEGTLPIEGQIGVELGLGAVCPLEDGLQQIDRGHLARAELGTRLDHRQLVETHSTSMRR
jgi:hypothetical protein